MIQTYFYRSMGTGISGQLVTNACIIKKSFNTGIFPTELKIARVIPLFKSGDTSLISNYRPVSVLPVQSKIFERLL